MILAIDQATSDIWIAFFERQNKFCFLFVRCLPPGTLWFKLRWPMRQVHVVLARKRSSSTLSDLWYVVLVIVPKRPILQPKTMTNSRLQCFLCYKTIRRRKTSSSLEVSKTTWEMSRAENFDFGLGVYRAALLLPKELKKTCIDVSSTHKIFSSTFPFRNFLCALQLWNSTDSSCYEKTRKLNLQFVCLVALPTDLLIWYLVVTG